MMQDGRNACTQISDLGLRRETLGHHSQVGRRRRHAKKQQWWAHEQTSGRRGQHKVGTGSSPSLSLVRARAHNKRANSRARSIQQSALLRSEGTTCGNAIPLKEHKREQRTATTKGEGEQDEERQSIAILCGRGKTSTIQT